MQDLLDTLGDILYSLGFNRFGKKGSYIVYFIYIKYMQYII